MDTTSLNARFSEVESGDEITLTEKEKFEYELENNKVIAMEKLRRAILDG